MRFFQSPGFTSKPCWTTSIGGEVRCLLGCNWRPFSFFNFAKQAGSRFKKLPPRSKSSSLSASWMSGGSSVSSLFRTSSQTRFGRSEKMQPGREVRQLFFKCTCFKVSGNQVGHFVKWQFARFSFVSVVLVNVNIKSFRKSFQNLNFQKTYFERTSSRISSPSLSLCMFNEDFSVKQ